MNHLAYIEQQTVYAQSAYSAMHSNMRIDLGLFFETRRQNLLMDALQSHTRNMLDIVAREGEGGLLNDSALAIAEDLLDGVTMTAEQSKAIFQGVQDIVDDARAQIASVAGADVRTAWAASRRFGLARVLRQSLAPLAPRSPGAAMAGLQFVASNRAGRMYSTDYACRVAFRGALMDIYAECSVFAIAMTGSDLAVAVPGSDAEEIVFSISGATPGKPRYEVIRNQLWHPNSTTLIKPYAP